MGSLPEPKLTDDTVHDLVWVDVTTALVDEPEVMRDAEHYKLKACLSCMAIVPPPHDGYVYHDYGCRLEPCTCKGVACSSS